MNDTSYILTINGGSSSIKFAFFNQINLTKVFAGKIDRIGMDDTYLETYDFETEKQVKTATTLDATPTILTSAIREFVHDKKLAAIGHRFVHGGNEYKETTLITNEVLSHLKTFVPFAPRHLPSEINIVEALLVEFPDQPQFVCFDTNFFKDIPRIAKILPIPYTFQAKGLMRYGFHGLSYEYMLHTLKESLHENIESKKVILAHLGGGASLAAISNGKPVETTMGFTPNSGIHMSTRSGDLDPGWKVPQNWHTFSKVC